MSAGAVVYHFPGICQKDLVAATAVNAVEAIEDVDFGVKVVRWRLEYDVNGAWTPVPGTETRKMGCRRVIRFPEVTSRRFRVVATEAKPGCVIEEMRLFRLPPEPRTVQPLNAGWRSTLQPSTSNLQPQPALAIDVTLPHSWLDYHGMRRLGHGNVHGSCTYARTFQAEPEAGRRCFLVFDGAGTYLTVRLNGVELCTHQPAGRLVSTIEATGALKPGTNALEVVCDHPSDIMDMPWVCGGCGPQSCEGPEPMGLFRPARLVVTDAVRIAPFGLQVVYDEQVRNGSVNVDLDNGAETAAVRTVRVVQPELGVDTSLRVELAAREKRTVRLDFPLIGAERWSPKRPKLYTFAVTLDDARGNVLDRDNVRTGFRTIRWPKTNPTGDRRFFVNDEPVYIHGVCETDHRFGGSMAFGRREIDARCDEIEMLGFNAFRDGHEPHDLHYSERWDEDGVLWWPQISTHVWVDTPAFRRNFRWAVEQWIRERRNSPSIVLWGLQNESIIPEDFAAEMTGFIHALDPLAGPRGRLVTSCNGGIGVDWDVVQNWSGTYGGRFGKLEDYQDALKKDDQLLNGEYGAWRVAGYHDDPDKPFVFEEPYTEEHACRVLKEKLVRAWRSKDAVCGQFLWTFFTHENPGRAWPDEGYRMIDKVGPINNKGPYTLWGRRTEAWYLYRAFAERLKNGTVDAALDQPLSRWLEEGHRLTEGAARPPLKPAAHTGQTCVFRLNCGGDALTDSNGDAWTADSTAYSHSWAEDPDMAVPGYWLDPMLGSQDVVQGRMTNVAEADEKLFGCFRYGRQRLRFTLPAPSNAHCTVDAYFVEPGSYGRVFDVALNGKLVEDDFNLGREGERTVIRRSWTVTTDAHGGIVLDFPEVAVNQAVVSALAVWCAPDDAARLGPLPAPGYPGSSNLTWKALSDDVCVKFPKDEMPGGEAATIFPIMANQPPPKDRDGYKCGWFGPHYANDYTVIFKVKSGNPVGKTIEWKLWDDHYTEAFGQGSFTVKELTKDGKVAMPIGFQVNAGWYSLMYRIEDAELVASEWR